MRRLILILLSAILLGACGTQATGSGVTNATLVLDFTPNAIHAGIYAAIARGYDRRNGVAFHVIIPSESTDAIKLLLTGRADFAILDIHDLAIARERGQDIVGVMAIVERPLAAVIAQPQVTSPRALDGRLVGVTGDPSDLAVLHSIVAGAGGTPRTVHTITIGYDAVADLLAGRVAAATAFWNDEGVTLSRTGRGFHVFRVEQYGAPPYPELVLCTTATELHRDPRLVHAVVRSIGRAMTRYSAIRPSENARSNGASGLSPSLVSAQLHAELPAFLPPGGGRYGLLVPSVLRAWAAWEAHFGIVSRPPDVSAMFDPAVSSGRSP